MSRLWTNWVDKQHFVVEEDNLLQCGRVQAPRERKVESRSHVRKPTKCRAAGSAVLLHQLDSRVTACTVSRALQRPRNSCTGPTACLVGSQEVAQHDLT